MFEAGGRSRAGPVGPILLVLPLSALLAASCPDPGLNAVVDLDLPVLQSPGEGACVLSTNNPLFVWAEVSGARSYEVEVSQDAELTVPFRQARNLQSSSVTFGEPFPLGEYFWQVTALGGNETIEKSEIGSFVVSAGLPPLQPETQEAPACGEAPVISWPDAHQDEPGMSYELEVLSEDGSGESVLSEAGLETCEHTLSLEHLEKGSTYRARVRRMYRHCPGPWAETEPFTVLGELPPPEDAVADFEGCGPFDVEFAWSYGQIPGGAVFEVEIDSGCGRIEHHETTEQRLSLVLESAATVWWRVRIKQDDGQGSHCASTWTEGERFTLVRGPGAPEGLDSGWEGCGPFDAFLSWDDSALPAEGWFEVEVEGELGYSQLFETAESPLELSLPAPDTYSWRIRINQDDTAEPPCASPWAEGPPLRTGSGRSWSRLTDAAAFSARESHGVVASGGGEEIFVIAGNA
ncbi:MAG: fibronectin type III domain-containing protein, partial [Myxococcota bacterium]